MDEQEKQAKVDALLKQFENDRASNERLQEAGGIAFMTLFTRTGAAVNVTARGFTSQAALVDLVHTAEWAMLALGMTTNKADHLPAAQPPAMPADQRIALEEGNKPLAAELHANAAELPPSRKGANVPYLTLVATTVKVLPQPDGKTTIEFYGDGRKYPDVKVNKWKVEAAQGLLKYVTAEPVDKAGEYKLDCVVYYTEGNSFTKPDGTSGNYKDVEHVRPLAF